MLLCLLTFLKKRQEYASDMVQNQCHSKLALSQSSLLSPTIWEEYLPVCVPMVYDCHGHVLLAVVPLMQQVPSLHLQPLAHENMTGEGESLSR